MTSRSDECDVAPRADWGRPERRRAMCIEKFSEDSRGAATRQGKGTHRVANFDTVADSKLHVRSLDRLGVGSHRL